MLNKELLLLLQNSGLTRLELRVERVPPTGNITWKIIMVRNVATNVIYDVSGPDGYALPMSTHVLAGSLSTNCYSIGVPLDIQGTMFYDDLEVGYFKNDRFYFYSDTSLIGKTWESLLGKTFIILS